jgi:hypothetical protein
MSCQDYQRLCSPTCVKEISKGIEHPCADGSDVYVVDGGFLLHAVHWPDIGTYNDVASRYVAYVTQHYGSKVIVVFDGYCNGPSTKDHEHERRAKKSSPDVVLEPDNTAYKDQKAFLANDKNKKGFVSLLMTRLTYAGHTVYQAPDDAETLVAKHVLLKASERTNCKVSVIANDTDIDSVGISL